jgi:hypothetical protein
MYSCDPVLEASERLAFIILTACTAWVALTECAMSMYTSV